MSDTSTMVNLLQDDYGPAIRNQLPEELPFLKEFESDTSARWQGRERIEPIKVNRNRGVYASAEGGAPPTAGTQKLEWLRIPCRYNHGSIQITKQLMEAASSDKGSWGRPLKLDMQDLLDSLVQQRGFYIFGTGTGIRALVNGDPGTGTTLTLDSPGAVAGANHGNRFLNVGDHIVAINPLSGLLRAGGTREITDIAAGGTTVTVAAAIDTVWADNDYIVKAYGTDASITIQNTEWQHAQHGMLALFDNGTYVNTYFNLSRTQFPVLQSTVISSVNSLSADVIQRGIDVATQVGGAKLRTHWCHMDTRRAYLTIMEQDRRYTGGELMSPDAGTKAAKGGYNDGIGFGGVPIKTDPHFPYGMWLGHDSRSCVRYVMNEGSWIDDDGAVLVRSTTAVDTFDATYRIFDNFAAHRPNQSFRLDGITTSFVIAHII